MVISKQHIAELVKRFPWTLSVMHGVWRLTRPRVSVGVIGVMANAAGEFLIVEHVFHSEPRWGFPGGYVERGEDPAAALAREFHEELSMTVEVGQILVLARAHHSHLDVAYLCHSSDDVGTLSNELLDYRWTAPDQFPPMRPFHRKALTQALGLLEMQP